MKLAKNCVDVALFTATAEPMLEFWQQEVGLPYEEPLPTGGGNMQHRHDLSGSVLKLNHTRNELPDAPRSGYGELWIAREGCDAVRRLVDPDGNRVVLCPPGTDGIEQVGVRMVVRDVEAHARWFSHVLGFEDAGGQGYACGETRFFIEAAEDATEQKGIAGPGFRYLTVQIWNCDEEHAGVLARGGREGASPRTLGEVARFSMVCDPDGNWVELSQRASLTGPLPK